MATQYDYVFQDRGHLLREVRTGKLYPFRIISLPAGTPVLPGANKRFFVKSVSISYAALAGDAGTELKVSGLVNLETNVLASIVKTGAIVDKGTEIFPCGILIDREKSLTFTAADITTKSCYALVAEVDDSG